MGLLNRAGPWLAGMMQRAAASPAETIVYTRKADGATADLTGRAWVGRTAFARTGVEAGAAVVWGDRDYLIPVADLAAGGVPFEPDRGDRIAHTRAGVTVTFEVMTPDTGEPEKRYSDAARTVWRVHTKEVTVP